MKKTKIYTSLDSFVSKKHEVKPISSMSEIMQEWITERSLKLLVSRNNAELMAGEELKKYIKDVHEQVFFKIGQHTYFLDYYLPKYRIAIEIDGGYHKARRVEDKERDMLFNNIGIRTIRISSKDVLSGNFISKLKYKLTPKKQRKKK